eukprot:436382-Pelagomonas_calceolata.AAC.3
MASSREGMHNRHPKADANLAKLLLKTFGIDEHDPLHAMQATCSSLLLAWRAEDHAHHFTLASCVLCAANLIGEAVEHSNPT